MKCLAIIPARGGSKRIPRKNIRDFLGKPIIAYSIETAFKSGLFDEVMVSTDDEEIAEVARSYDAAVPFMRSKQTADDFSGTSDVLVEVLQEYEKEGRLFDFGCCIYPTAPMIKEKHLKNGYQLLVKNMFEMVFPIVEFGYPIFRSLKRSLDGKVVMNWPEYLKARSQDLPEAYHDAGQFYWFNVDTFLKNPTLFSGNCGSILLKPSEVQDIDTNEDWKLAEIKARALL